MALIRKINRTSLFTLLFKPICVSVAVASLALGRSAAAQNERYIVELRPGTGPAQVAAQHGVAPRQVYTHVLNGFAADLPPGRLMALARDPRVANIAVDHEVFAFGKPTPPAPAPAGEVVPAGVARIGGPGDGTGIGVAILDTGLDFGHPDLLISPSSFVSPGFTYTTSAQDDNGHGTHVGGIVAARQNGVGVVGVAPGATLYAVKVLNSSGSGNDSDIIAGLDWVAAIVLSNPTVTPAIKVVNMSLGRPTGANDSPMQTAIANLITAGVTVVVAAGNDASKQISDMVPARFPQVIAVASTTAKTGTSNTPKVIAADTASYFTTDGEGVAISAPGEEQENIKYPRISSVGILSTALGGGTTRMSGTSMAAPHAAAVVAVLLKNHRTLVPEDVKSCIMLSAERAGVAPLDSPTGGYSFDSVREGILSLQGALSAAEITSTPTTVTTTCTADY